MIHISSALRRLRISSVLSHDESKLLLSKWRHSPTTGSVALKMRRRLPYSNFQEAIALSHGGNEWKTISYKEIIPIIDDDSKTNYHHEQKTEDGRGAQTSDALDKVRHIMLRFENTYPKSVATIVGDWQETNRNMKVGDRFIESIPLIPDVPPYFDGLISMTCMDEVAHIYDLPDRCGFTVVTTDEHDEIGEHTAWVRLPTTSNESYHDGVEWKKCGNALILESVSSSKFKSNVFGPGLTYARWLQQRAHNLGQQYLVKQITNELLKNSLPNGPSISVSTKY